MDFQLKEVGVTLILGAYCLFGLELLLYWLFRSNALLQLEKSTRFTPRILVGLSVPLCFTFGMLMEDVSDKFDDRETTMQSVVKWLLPFTRTDDDIKPEALYGTAALEDSRKEVDPLARELAVGHLFCNYGGLGGPVVEDSILQTNTLAKTDQATSERVARQLYYHAKNVVYLQDNYYDEMKNIQQRIDFARSFFAISFLFIPFTLVLVSIKSMKMGLGLRGGGGSSPPRKKLLRLLWEASFVIAVLLGFCTLSIFSYQAEERQFDVRAYGYFSSLHTSGNSAVAKAIHRPSIQQTRVVAAGPLRVAQPKGAI